MLGRSRKGSCILALPRSLNRLNLSYRIVASVCGTNRSKSLLSHLKSTRTSIGTHSSFVELDLDGAKICTPCSPMYVLQEVSKRKKSALHPHLLIIVPLMGSSAFSLSMILLTLNFVTPAATTQVESSLDSLWRTICGFSSTQKWLWFRETPLFHPSRGFNPGRGASV